MKSIKLSKRSWIIITIGTFLILIAGLSVIYFRQIREYEDIKEQLSRSQQNLEQIQLDGLTSSRDDYEQELKDVNWQLDKVESKLSIPVASSAITKTLFDVAENHNLKVNNMTSSIPVNEKMEDIIVSRTTLTARVEGNYYSFINFIHDLGIHFRTGVFRSVTMVMPDDLDADQPSVEFQMDIYTSMR